ncbi:MAG: amidohydrolase family protein, partial [Pseudomonadota bacterium]
LATVCRERGIAIASHDDATVAHVDEARELNTSVAEFPTSFEAAEASHEAGMGVLMGAPNVVRGKSHSGNIAARDLASLGVLDILSSDYVPFSLIHAPFVLADEIEAVDLPKAIAMVTANPAKQVGLNDRGTLSVGKRADVVRVHPGPIPVVREVWREGHRVI